MDRVESLLDRGTALAVAVERWESNGIWVISRSDSHYPGCLKQYLSQTAPLLLYGVGPKEVLDRGGVAVVGSRNRSEEDGAFARRIGEHCAQEGIAIISGAAKGIDRDAMDGALESGGWAIGVLAEGLAKTATSRKYREMLVSDRLTLVSPYEPDSRWLAYAAMERNKLLYALGDAALVVASAAETGGTWAGAAEAIQHGKVRVFVKSTGTQAPGNPNLLRMGGLPVPDGPRGFVRELSAAREGRDGGSIKVKSPDEPSTMASGFNVSNRRKSLPGTPDVRAELPSRDVYPLVICAMLELLQVPHRDKLLAARMCVRVEQVRDWLKRGVSESRIKKLKKPVRYVASPPTLFGD